MDCNPPGSSVHGDSPGKNCGVGCHAASSRRSYQPWDGTQASSIAGGFFTVRATRHLKRQSSYSEVIRVGPNPIGAIFPGGSDGKVSATVQEIRVQPLGREDLLEKEMATHSSILAWKIPWMEEAGRLQSMGS